MEITKSDIRKYYYFIEIVDDKPICNYGQLVSILPKYNFQDDFASSYKREQNYLFEVKEASGQLKGKAIVNPEYIFEDLDSVIKYGVKNKIVILFSHSVLKIT